MPYVKPGKLGKPPKSAGIPDYSLDYTVHLNMAHLTEQTVKLLQDDINDTGPRGMDLSLKTGIIVSMQRHRTAHWNYEVMTVDFRATADEKLNIAALPPDLRECVMFAASFGANSIVFEPAHPDDLPYAKCLAVYLPGEAD